MPTIITQNPTLPTEDKKIAPNPGAGPKIVLDQTPEEPTTSMQPHPTTSDLKPVPKATAPVTQPEPKPFPENKPHVEANLEELDKLQAELTAKLAHKHSEETKLLEQVQELIKQTGQIEGSEAELHKQLQELQDMRKNIAAQPEKAAEHIQNSAFTTLVKDIEPTPAEPAAPAATKPDALKPVEMQVDKKILNALRQTFSNTDPAIAATLTANATVEQSDDGGVLITGNNNQVHFSPEDLRQANITAIDVAMLPKTTLKPNAIPEPMPAPEIAPVQSEPTPTPRPVTAGTMNAPAAALLEKILPHLTSEQQAALVNPSSLQRSADGNGIVITTQTGDVHLSDADLIRASITSVDLQNISTSTQPVATTTEPTPAEQPAQTQPVATVEPTPAVQTTPEQPAPVAAPVQPTGPQPTPAQPGPPAIG